MDPIVLFKIKNRVAHSPPDPILTQRMEMKPHKCKSPGCPKTYKDIKSRDRHHEQCHEKQTKYNCNKCRSSFTRADYLHKHKRRFHPSPPTFTQGTQTRAEDLVDLPKNSIMGKPPTERKGSKYETNFNVYDIIQKLKRTQSSLLQEGGCSTIEELEHKAKKRRIDILSEDLQLSESSDSGEESDTPCPLQDLLEKEMNSNTTPSTSLDPRPFTTSIRQPPFFRTTNLEDDSDESDED